jgi:hypothetical protein
MRVKLSYTVEGKDVLKEGAKILGLCGEDLQQGVNLFKEVQTELKGENDEETGIPNVPKALEMIEEFRLALLNVDTRLAEVSDIIKGYDEYRVSQTIDADRRDQESREDDVPNDVLGSD